eukprot:gene18931-6287_t
MFSFKVSKWGGSQMETRELSDHYPVLGLFWFNVYGEETEEEVDEEKDKKIGPSQGARGAAAVPLPDVN